MSEEKAESRTSGPPSNDPKLALAADKLSLRELFARLPVGQLWGFIGVVCGLVAAALGAGWAFRGTVDDTKLQAAAAKADDMDRERARTERERDAEAEKARQLHAKDRFLSLYLRYVLAREGIDTSIDKADAMGAFDDYVKALVDRDRLILKKGSDRLATVSFPDGTVWTLPREVHRAQDK